MIFLPYFVNLCGKRSDQIREPKTDGIFHHFVVMDVCIETVQKTPLYLHHRHPQVKIFTRNTSAIIILFGTSMVAADQRTIDINPDEGKLGGVRRVPKADEFKVCADQDNLP